MERTASFDSNPTSLISNPIDPTELHFIMEIDCLDYKVVKVFLSALSGLAIGAAVGGAAGYVWGSVTIGVIIFAPAGAIVAALIGVMYFQSTDVALRLKLIELLEEELLPTSDIYQALERIKTVVSSDVLYFENPRINHAFHYKIIDMTEQLRNDPTTKSLWGAFLHSIDGASVQYGDGTCLLDYFTATYVQADFSLALERLQNQQTRYHIQQLNPRSPNFDADIQQIRQLELEGFTRKMAWSTQYIKTLLTRQDTACLIARKEGSDEILGILIYRALPDGTDAHRLHISTICRKAGTAKMGIGNELFNILFSRDLKAFTRVTLEVSEHNDAAIELYQKFGFVEVPANRVANYYAFPREDALFMQITKDQFSLRHSVAV